jgi:hypothetical protein
LVRVISTTGHFQIVRREWMNPAGVLVDADDIAGEVLDPDRAVFPLRHRQIGAMHGGQAAGLCQAELLAHQERIVVGELLIGRVAHVGGALAVDEQRAERRGIDAESRSLSVRHLRQHIDAIAVVCRKGCAMRFVQAADSHDGNLPSWLGL